MRTRENVFENVKNDVAQEQDGKHMIANGNNITVMKQDYIVAQYCGDGQAEGQDDRLLFFTGNKNRCCQQKYKADVDDILIVTSLTSDILQQDPA